MLWCVFTAHGILQEMYPSRRTSVMLQSACFKSVDCKSDGSLLTVVRSLLFHTSSLLF